MTRSIRLALALAAVAALPFASAVAHEPAAPASPEDITHYYESGEWDIDVTAISNRAATSLKSQLRKKPGKPAIVFDIDDTLESTYRCAKESNFDRNAISACQARTDQDPIQPVWKLLRLAQRRQVALVLITGRPEGLRDATRAQLKRDGLTGRYRLVMRPNDEFGGPAEGYKAAARRAMQRRGFKILVNIGDQRSDLDGGYSVKRFKLPNPMYFTP